MARIIKKGKIYCGVSSKLNTKGNKNTGKQKPYIIARGNSRIKVLKKLRKEGYSI